ncbi:hypothetical protein FEM48_Zijuj10G0017700 [Ziziphus jujuba var. spinosa]|uniref:DC1 domain-containing protein n=1 Tax=Ziziphus jujuba var. spinosa TaxID=714518 RepID=A0A978UKK3_ZIZJJ|nr:hypothetical protein FEM48_Zijuj10G0017700 [Ziziphus jujuba var. spinosa]
MLRHHEHPLMHCVKTGFDDVLHCFACNTLCKSNSYLCFDCNFNIHSECLLLPLTINYYDHVHPFTLISSFQEDDSNNYYYDICEERRDPDHGVYYCEECLCFVAHFECTLSLKGTTELEVSSSKQLEDIAVDEVVSEKYTIFLQWDAEIDKLREVVKKLSIKERV